MKLWLRELIRVLLKLGFRLTKKSVRSSPLAVSDILCERVHRDFPLEAWQRYEWARKRLQYRRGWHRRNPRVTNQHEVSWHDSSELLLEVTGDPQS